MLSKKSYCDGVLQIVLLVYMEILLNFPGKPIIMSCRMKQNENASFILERIS